MNGNDAYFPGGGRLGALVRAFDWAATALGPIESWPQSLRTAVNLILLSPVPIVMLWGEDGFMIYNDAYSVFAGGRHPKLLGSKVREGWPEVADFNDNVMRVGLSGGTLAYRDQELTLYRHGEPERVWMNLDYSPVLDESGRPAGVIAIVVETTARVLADRRSAFLSGLSDAVRPLTDPKAVMAEAAGRLCRHMGADRVGYGEVEGDGDDMVLAVEHEALAPGQARIAGRYRVRDYDTTFLADLATGQPIAVDDVAIGPTATPSGLSAYGRLGVRAQIVVPLAKTGRLSAVLFVHSAVPRRWTCDEVQLVIDVGERTWAAVERARAESALREREEHFRSMVELDPQTTWTAQPNGQLDDVSGRWFEWTGTSGLGDNWSKGLHEDDRERTWEAWTRAVGTGDPYDIEHRVKMRDGSHRWMHSRAFARRDAAGAILKWYGTTEDIHERRMAVAALLESEERFRTIADSAPALIWMTDADGRITFANQHYARDLGYPPATVVEQGWQHMLHADDLEPFAAAFQSAFAERRPFVAEVRVWDRDGRLRWLRCQGVPRRDAQGAFLGYTGANLDITEARLAQEDLERRVQERTSELAAANRQLTSQIEERERVEATLRQMQRLEAVGQLTSGVAHDFNNLLTVVLGSIRHVEKSLKAVEIDARTRDRLGHMRAAAERGAALTSQLLAFSRKQRLEARAIDLNDTLAHMSDLLRSSMGGAVRLVTDPADGLWPAMVDPAQIELVILNLAINARDAMPNGGTLRIGTSNVSLPPSARPEDPAPGDYVRVSVADTGTGMTPDVLAKAFEPFFTTKPVGKGSGLGLAQVYGFAKQSGGGVKIDTKVGEGTTVKVFLPRATTPVRAAPTPHAAGPEGRIDGRARRVLLVDDDSAVREVTAGLLADLGCQVVEAGSGGAALELMSHMPDAFDLLVLDYAMPGMNGAELAREVQARHPGIPVLFVTGYADLTALGEIGEDRVVQKPFRDDELAMKVRRLLLPPLSATAH